MPNPRHLEGALAALRRAQRKLSRRRGPDRRTRQRPSNRWRKAKTRVTALHTRVANQRRDGLHKLTTRLVRDHDTIVIEDLHVAGMVRNRRLARAISGLGMAELRRQIEYKAADAGVRVVIADRWYPSSKTCSACGAVRAKLTLAERQFICESCGTQLDRDRNAALNLAALAGQIVQAKPHTNDLLANHLCGCLPGWVTDGYRAVAVGRVRRVSLREALVVADVDRAGNPLTASTGGPAPGPRGRSR